MDVKGNTVLSGSLKISADATPGRVYIVGSDGEVLDSSALNYSMMGGFQVTGAATISNGLTVNGAAADFNADVTANKISIDGDTSGRLYMVGSSGEIMDQAQLTFADGSLAVKTTMGVSKFSVDSSSGNVTVEGILDVNSALSASVIKIDSDVAQRLYIVDADGSIKDESKLTFDGSELLVQGNIEAVDALFTGNVQVDGDLRVKGSMTYIDTQNMRVQDAFIYLATGSAGTTDSGIVLHEGAGVGMDLVIGQDSGAGEVIFGKMDRSPDGSGAMAGIQLVAAWANEVKLGGFEGSLSGSLAAEAGAGDVRLKAVGDLALEANGFTMELGTSAQYTTFDSNFSATTIVGALNELYAAGAGGSKKGNLSVAEVSAGVLTFSSIGTLGSASQQFVDVYLNGVLLAYGKDLSSVTTTTITIDGGIASALTADDCLTVVLRGAA